MSLHLQNGGTVPSAFSLNLSTKMFVITQGVAITTGSYNLMLVATETFSPSNPKQTSCMWTVKVICTTSISVLTNSTPPMNTYVLNPNQLNTLTLALPTYSNTPASCSWTPIYSVINSATGLCSSWITCSPTTSI